MLVDTANAIIQFAIGSSGGNTRIASLFLGAG